MFRGLALLLGYERHPCLPAWKSATLGPVAGAAAAHGLTRGLTVPCHPCPAFKHTRSAYPLADGLASLAPLAGSLRHLSVLETLEGEGAERGYFAQPSAEALQRALPGLQILVVDWGAAIQGAALAVLLHGMRSLRSFKLCTPTLAPDDVVSAACVVRPEPRGSPLELCLTGRWDYYDALDVMDAWSDLAQPLPVGEPQLYISADEQLRPEEGEEDEEGEEEGEEEEGPGEEGIV